MQGSLTLYVIHEASPNIVVVDPATLSVVQRVHVGPGASAIKVDPRTDRIFLARRAGPGVEIFDPSSLLPIDSIPTTGPVDFMAIDGEGRNLCLLLADSQQARIVGLVSKKTIGAIDVGADPFWAVFPGEL